MFIPSTKTAWVFLLLAVVVVGALAGCGSADPAETSTTGASTATTSTTGSDTSTTSTSAVVEMTDWDKEIAATATMQHELTEALVEENAEETDPRMAIIYGLSARTQAIYCRQALERDELDLADTAMREVYYKLNMAKPVVEGTVAQTIADARAIVETLGSPSSAPTEAATLLEQFIAALAPLLDEAAAVTSSTTTTS